MSDIKKLLNKKGWTGKELGQIEIANMAYMFEQQLQGKEPKPLVSRGEFSKMLSTIKDPMQGKAYNEYIKIHEWLSLSYNVTSAQFQQAQGNFRALLHHIETAEAGEKTYRYINKLPVIMTEKQYKDYVEKRTEEIVNPQEGKKGFNLFSMLIEAIEGLVDQLQSNPRKANPLKALKPKLEAQRVKDPRILSRYNEVMRNGYYVIDDTGQRSDNMTIEEWTQAIVCPEVAEAKENGTIPPTVERLEAISRATFNGASEELIKELLEDNHLARSYTFCPYEDPPEDLNRWEILQVGDLGEYYRSLWGCDPDGEELLDDNYTQAVIADIEAFRKEYPEVFAAVLKDMRKYIGDDVDTPIEEWATTVYSWAYLYKENYYNFNDEYVGDTQIFAGNRRAIFNGVAILKESTFNKHMLDKNGYYKEPNILDSLTPHMLEGLFPDSPDYAIFAEEIEDAREYLLDSYAFMLGFNKALDLIKQYYNLPQLYVFKFDTEGLAERMDAFNDLASMLYAEIKQTDYEDAELKKKKLQALKDFLYPIEYKDIVITQESTDKAIQLFKDGGAFEGANLTDILCRRTKGGV